MKEELRGKVMNGQDHFDPRTQMHCLKYCVISPPIYIQGLFRRMIERIFELSFIAVELPCNQALRSNAVTMNPPTITHPLLSPFFYLFPACQPSSSFFSLSDLSVAAAAASLAAPLSLPLRFLLLSHKKNPKSLNVADPEVRQCRVPRVPIFTSRSFSVFFFCPVWKW
ncbi:hypothetical protein Droror1_Dr00024061 [Drosera rotundifolia]